MRPVKIRIGKAVHGFIYHRVGDGMWNASEAKREIKSLWIGERGSVPDSEKVLILVEFECLGGAQRILRSFGEVGGPPPHKNLLIL